MSGDLTFVSAVSECEHRSIRRTLKDLAGVFHDAEAVSARLSESNSVIYEFHEYVAGRTREELVVAACTLFPGKIGNELHMTRGHFHDPANYAEVYHVHSGQGLLLMQSPDGRFVSAAMEPGAILYVPPDYFHRTVNTGERPLVFFGVYSGETDHDYGQVPVEEWFAKIVVEVGGQARIVDNPRRVATKGADRSARR
jgi:glucose-6-phosphate isomerase